MYCLAFPNVNPKKNEAFNVQPPLKHQYQLLQKMDQTLPQATPSFFLYALLPLLQFTWDWTPVVKSVPGSSMVLCEMPGPSCSNIG